MSIINNTLSQQIKVYIAKMCNVDFLSSKKLEQKGGGVKDKNNHILCMTSSAGG